MKKDHKMALIAVLLTLIAIAIINNVSALKTVKELVYGKSGWF